MITLAISGTTIVANAADDVKVTLGGRMDTQAGFVNEKARYQHVNPNDSTSPLMRSNGIITDTKIDVNIDAKSDKGFTYGGLIRLNADNSKSTSDSSAVTDRTMMYVQSNKFGRIEAGNMPSAGALLESDVDNFDVGTYGVNGYWGSWNYNRTSKGSSLATLGSDFGAIEYAGFQFIRFPNLPSFYATPYYSNAPKISYFAKALDVLTAGISFIPDMDSHGTTAGLSLKNNVTEADFNERKNPASFKDIVSGGIRFEKSFGDYSVKLTATGETGRAKSYLLRNLKAYEVGTMLGYKSFKLGASYGDWGKSLTLRKSPIQGRKVRQDYWTAGFGQVFESWGYSVTRMESKKAGGLEILSTLPYGPAAQAGNALANNLNGYQSLIVDTRCNRFDNTVLDVEYKLAQGIKLYSGYSTYQFKESNGNKNKGHVLMLGSRLLF